MKFFKRIISLIVIIVFSLLLALPAFAATYNPPAPTHDYLPLRLIAEAIGYDVTWQGLGKPIILSGYNCQKNVKNYALIGSRAYVDAAFIPLIFGNEVSADVIVSISEIVAGIYRLAVQLSDEAPKVVEQAFISQIDKLSCSIILYSDGDDQQPGGPHTVLIEITVPARTFAP